MTIQIARRSRLRFSTFLVGQGVEFWDLPDYPSIPELPDDLQYQMTAVDRLDLLAYRYYGDQIFWWVIALANGLELVQTEVYVGLILRIPSPRYVSEQLFRSVGR